MYSTLSNAGNKSQNPQEATSAKLPLIMERAGGRQLLAPFQKAPSRHPVLTRIRICMYHKLTLIALFFFSSHIVGSPPGCFGRTDTTRISGI